MGEGIVGGLAVGRGAFVQLVIVNTVIAVDS